MNFAKVESFNCEAKNNYPEISNILKNFEKDNFQQCCYNYYAAV